MGESEIVLKNNCLRTFLVTCRRPLNSDLIKTMNSFFRYNRSGELQFGPHNLAEVTSELRGPTFFYSSMILDHRLKVFATEVKKNLRFPPKIFFAMKANHNRQVLDHIRQQNIGVDVVSGGELRLALDLGFAPDQIIFSGVGKSIDDLQLAASRKIFQINIENFGELKRLCKIQNQLRTPSTFQTPLKIGLRLNLDIDAGSHPKITTGRKIDKFGLSPSDYLNCLDLLKNETSLVLGGLTIHLGSQILKFKSFKSAFALLKEKYVELFQLGFAPETLDVGGGLGIDYNGSNREDVLILKKWSAGLAGLNFFKGQVLIEPGRFLVARCGVLLAQVEYLKKNKEKEFLILNSGMNHLLRPALYDSFHEISQVSKKLNKKARKFEVVGPVCESSDTFGKGRLIVDPKEGDWVAIHDCGAYGSSMSSDYNLFSRADEVLV